VFFKIGVEEYLNSAQVEFCSLVLENHRNLLRFNHFMAQACVVAGHWEVLTSN